MYNNGADNTRFYYIGFEGTSSKKRRTFKLQVQEGSINTTNVAPKKEEHVHDHLIYG